MMVTKNFLTGKKTGETNTVKYNKEKIIDNINIFKPKSVEFLPDLILRNIGCI